MLHPGVPIVLRQRAAKALVLACSCTDHAHKLLRIGVHNAALAVLLRTHEDTELAALAALLLGELAHWCRRPGHREAWRRIYAVILGFSTRLDPTSEVSEVQACQHALHRVVRGYHVREQGKSSLFVCS